MVVVVVLLVAGVLMVLGALWVVLVLLLGHRSQLVVGLGLGACFQVVEDVVTDMWGDRFLVGGLCGLGLGW